MNARPLILDRNAVWTESKVELNVWLGASASLSQRGDVFTTDCMTFSFDECVGTDSQYQPNVSLNPNSNHEEEKLKKPNTMQNRKQMHSKVARGEPSAGETRQLSPSIPPSAYR